MINHWTSETPAYHLLLCALNGQRTTARNIYTGGFISKSVACRDDIRTQIQSTGSILTKNWRSITGFFNYIRCWFIIRNLDFGKKMDDLTVQSVNAVPCGSRFTIYDNLTARTRLRCCHYWRSDDVLLVLKSGVFIRFFCTILRTKQTAQWILVKGED